MIDFDAIGLHDLVELEADGRHIEVAGWYHVEWIGGAWGEKLLEVEILGTHKQPRTLRKTDAAQILRHIRTAAAPGAIDTLENIMYVGIDAMRRYGKVFNVDELRARGEAALRAVRGETDAAAEARKKAPEGPEPLGEWK